MLQGENGALLFYIVLRNPYYTISYFKQHILLALCFSVLACVAASEFQSMLYKGDRISGPTSRNFHFLVATIQKNPSTTRTGRKKYLVGHKTILGMCVCTISKHNYFFANVWYTARRNKYYYQSIKWENIHFSNQINAHICLQLT